MTSVRAKQKHSKLCIYTSRNHLYYSTFMIEMRTYGCDKKKVGRTNLPVSAIFNGFLFN